MKPPIGRAILVSALVLLHLASGPLSAHGHAVAGGPSGNHELRSHDCLDVERHAQPGAEHPCVLCQRIVQVVPSMPAGAPPPDASSAPVILATTDRPTSPAVVAPRFMRGPPLLG